MVKFRISVNIDGNKGFFNHQSKTLTIGSCFANHIYQRLNEQGFQIDSNPFGILFNPISIEKNIRNAFSTNVNESRIIERDNLFFHYDCHSEIYSDSKDALIQNINSIQSNFSGSFAKLNRLIITFGTAWVYRHLKTGEIVANCHKVPQKEFKKELLQLDELISIYESLLINLTEKNKNLEILITVSPVRHIKNGVHKNNLSKSVLLLLCDHLVQRFDFAHYFPAYELVMDDLRDYRFYESDLIHPNKQAIDYVIDQFKASYFNEKTNEIAKLALKVNQLKNHKLLHSTTESEQKRAQKIDEMEAALRRLKSQP